MGQRGTTLVTVEAVPLHNTGVGGPVPCLCVHGGCWRMLFDCVFFACWQNSDRLQDYQSDCALQS
jgi:hypothetical protein